MGKLVYYRSGQVDGDVVTSPKECGKCARTALTVYVESALNFQETDMQGWWRQDNLELVNRAITASWTQIWNNFSCQRRPHPAPDDAVGQGKCRAREACGSAPVAIEAGAETYPQADTDVPRGEALRWRIFVTVVREIKCVDKSGESDVAPIPYTALPPSLDISITSEPRAQVPYYRFGAVRDSVQETTHCGQCTRIGGTYVYQDVNAQGEYEAQFLWAGARVKIVNLALGHLWPALWNAFHCQNGSCGTKEACGDSPVFIEVGTIAVPVEDFSAPLRVRVVWRIYVTIQREIKCTSADKKTERDVTPKSYETLPPDEKDLPPGKHTGH